MEEKYFLVRDLEKSQDARVPTPGHIIYSELIQCARESDAQGIRRIYSAIVDWEKRISPETPVEDRCEIAGSALDLLCRAADFYYDSLGDDASIQSYNMLNKTIWSKAKSEPDCFVGKTRGFFRTELGFCQLPKKDWLNYIF